MVWCVISHHDVHYVSDVCRSNKERTYWLFQLTESNTNTPSISTTTDRYSTHYSKWVIQCRSWAVRMSEIGIRDVCTMCRIIGSKLRLMIPSQNWCWLWRAIGRQSLPNFVERFNLVWMIRIWLVGLGGGGEYVLLCAAKSSVVVDVLIGACVGAILRTRPSDDGMQ